MLEFRNGSLHPGKVREFAAGEGDLLALMSVGAGATCMVPATTAGRGRRKSW